MPHWGETTTVSPQPAAIAERTDPSTRLVA